VDSIDESKEMDVSWQREVYWWCVSRGNRNKNERRSTKKWLKNVTD
jgi:hypothetical protein